MNPSTSLRLDTMMRTLEQTIIPAIREDQPLAQEQAALMLGHLAALKQQGSREGEVDVRCRALVMTLCDELLELSAEEKALKVFRDDLRAARDSDDVDAVARHCEALLANTDASEDFKRGSFRSLARYAHAHTTLGRAWYLPMGFDGNPGEVADLDTLL